MINSQKILNYAKKIKIVNKLGGKCVICGDNNIHHLQFNHIFDKKYEVSQLINKGYRWSLIELEANKCELMCGNCHSEHHFNERNSNDERQITKKIFLEYKGNECEVCNYKKCQSSLTFHHIEPLHKEIQFSKISIRYKTLSDVEDFIEKELDKCQLLCINCHSEKHIDIDFYRLNEEEILLKVDNMMELRSAIDYKEVYRLYDNGMRQSEICKYFNCGKSTISGIIKKYKAL